MRASAALIGRQSIEWPKSRQPGSPSTSVAELPQGPSSLIEVVEVNLPLIARARVRIAPVSLLWVTRFSSRSAQYRSMMGSGRQGVSNLVLRPWGGLPGGMQFFPDGIVREYEY